MSQAEVTSSNINMAAFSIKNNTDPETLKTVTRSGRSVVYVSGKRFQYYSRREMTKVCVYGYEMNGLCVV